MDTQSGPSTSPAPPLPALLPPGRPLTARERTRFARHLLLPGVGEIGQRRLRAARVLLVGAGGLGSSAGLYLAAAGVGTIGVVDDDVVDLSNLQRQILHGSADVGALKVESGREALRAVSEDLVVSTHPERLDPGNILQILSDYDLVVDGADNFPTRALVSRACTLLGLPHVWASVHRFDAQISIWWPHQGPCYHCVFPNPPAPGLVPSCAVGGVLGSTVGAVGSVLATETIKVITGVGSPLVGRLLVHDGLEQRWDSLPVRRNPDCEVCGREAGADGLLALAPVDEAERVADSEVTPCPGVSVTELADLLASVAPPTLIDVREPGEREIAVIPGAISLPIDRIRRGDLDGLGAWLESSADSEPTDLCAGGPVYVHCKSGGRSAEAVNLLRTAGVDARDVRGGILAWIAEVDPNLPTY